MNEHVDKQHVVSPEIERRLERVAERQHRSIDDVLRSALVDYLDRVELDDERVAELDDRAREMAETGLHLTHEEVSDWLRRAAKGERPPRPKAHT